MALTFAHNPVRKSRSPEQSDGIGVTQAPDDATLIRDARRGDRQAFGLIVERYFRAAYASAYAVLGHAGDAEEIAQETFVQAYQKLDRLREPSALPGWIWRIARDSALKHIRKHKRMKPMGELPEKGDDQAPVQPLLEQEEKETLLQAMNQLPEEMQQALQMKFWQDMEYDDMARATGVSAAALYQRVCRGLKRLRELMEGP